MDFSMLNFLDRLAYVSQTQQLKLKILTLQKPFKRAQIDQLKASHERFESLTK